MLRLASINTSYSSLDFLNSKQYGSGPSCDLRSIVIKGFPLNYQLSSQCVLVGMLLKEYSQDSWERYLISHPGKVKVQEARGTAEIHSINSEYLRTSRLLAGEPVQWLHPNQEAPTKKHISFWKDYRIHLSDYFQGFCCFLVCFWSYLGPPHTDLGKK